MRVFISWSGQRSAAVADALRYWLPKVIQALEPWMSADDIEKGTRWRSGLASELEQSSIGIICLTRENLDSTWIHFEAGALSKQQQNTYVCTLLFDLEPTDVREPLAQFQHTRAIKDDLRRLISTINNTLNDLKLPESELSETFEMWWPKLEERLLPIRDLPSQLGPIRTDRELLEEILNLVRTQENLREARDDDADKFTFQYLDWLRGLIPPDLNPEAAKTLGALLFQLQHQEANRKHRKIALKHLDALRNESTTKPEEDQRTQKPNENTYP
jgi:TIR domain-containing protein